MSYDQWFEYPDPIDTGWDGYWGDYPAPWTPSSSIGPNAITFPAQGLKTRIWIALNPDFTQSYLTWSWYDITEKPDGTTITRWEQLVDIVTGARAYSNVVEPSQCNFRASNTDSLLSRRNPLSPLYSQLNEYTPVWVSVDYGLGWKDKYFGYIHDFSKAWDKTGKDAYVDLTARGPFHRLNRSKPLLDSLTRAINSTKPVAHWALNDGMYATLLASQVAGVAPIDSISHATPGSSTPDSWIPIALTANNDGNNFGGVFSNGLVTTDNQKVSVCFRYRQISGADNTFACTTYTVNNLHLEVFVNDAANQVRVGISDADGNDLGGGTFWEDIIADGTGHFFVATFEQQGANIAFHLYMDGTERGLTSNLIAGQTLMNVEKGDLQWGPGTLGGPTGSMAVDHWAIWNIIPDIAYLSYAATGFNGEEAHKRLTRIFREINVPFFTMAGESVPCGPQEPGNVMDIARVAATVDGGVLYEYQFGGAYKAYGEYANQPVHFTADSASGQVIDIGSPIDNDLNFRNQWTVSRPHGSSATVQGRKGESGITLGDDELVYDDQTVVPVQFDSQLPDVAGRLVRRDTIDEDRYPVIEFNLAKNPELIQSWMEFPFGGRINALNVYEQVGVRTLDQIHRGHRERFNSKIWVVLANTTPALVHETLEIESTTQHDRVDTDSSELLADIDTAQTSFVVVVNDVNEDYWSFDGADVPMDLKLYPGTGSAIASGGETMHVGQIGYYFRDEFDRVTANGFGSADTGQAWTVTNGPVADFSTTGLTARISLSTVTLRSAFLLGTSLKNFDIYGECTFGVVPTGAQIWFSIIGRYFNINNNVGMRLVYDPGNFIRTVCYEVRNGVEVTTTFKLVNAPSTTSNMAYRFRVWDGNLYNKVWLTTQAEPLAWTNIFTNTNILEAGALGVSLAPQAGFSNVLPVTLDMQTMRMLTPQTFSGITRATNGIVKAHKAGTKVRLDPFSVLG